MAPTLDKLRGLEEDGPKLMMDSFTDNDKDEEEVLKTFMKVSSVVPPNDQASKDLAAKYADALFSSLLKKDPGFTFPNSILVHLGLLKSEDKMKPPVTITGPLIVLEHVVKQPYFPKAALPTLKLFLSRPHKLLQASVTAQDALMKTLYTIC